MDVLYDNLSVHHMCTLSTEAMDPLELEFLILASYHVGAGNLTQAMCNESPTLS